MIPAIVILGLVLCGLLVKWGGVCEDCDHREREQFRQEKENQEK